MSSVRLGVAGQRLEQRVLDCLHLPAMQDDGKSSSSSTNSLNYAYLAQMIPVGSLVKFAWWSDYRAPSVNPDASRHVTWHEVSPGDTGIVLHEDEDENYCCVLFTRYEKLLRIHVSMLEVV